MLAILDLFFLTIIFEGAVRRFVAPEWGIEIQLFRDALPMIAFAIFLTSYRRDPGRIWLPPVVKISLTLYFLVGIVQLFNPELWGIAVGLNGIRTHFAYLPLLLLAPLYLSTVPRVTDRLVLLSLIVLPVAALGILQTQLPPGHPLNANVNEAYFGSEGLIRASGTFSYISGYSVFCQFGVVASVALLMLRPLGSRVGVLAAGAGILAFAGCLSSGSRGSVYGALVQIVILAGMLLWSRFRTRLMKRILTTTLVAALGLTIVVNWFPQVYSAFVERAETAGDDLQERYVSGFVGWVSVLDEDLIGKGIGMAHQQAATLVGGEAGFVSGREAELDRIAYELGIIGFGALLVFKIALLLNVGFGARALHHPVRAVLAALSFSTMAMMIAGGVYTPMANALFMLMAGVGVSVVRINASPVSRVDQLRFLSQGPTRSLTTAR